jgi:hypothetical protein
VISLPHRAPVGLALANLFRALRSAAENRHLPGAGFASVPYDPAFSPLDFPALAPDQVQEQRYGRGRQDTIRTEGDR